MKLSAAAEILIVDDDSNLRYLMAEAARRSGKFKAVHTAVDGEDALRQVRLSLLEPGRRPVDFILSDLSMPRLDGLQLLRTLKKDEATRHIPFAIITSSDVPNDREQATEAGCCAFFHKPVRIEELIAVIASLPQLCAANSAAG